MVSVRCYCCLLWLGLRVMVVGYGYASVLSVIVMVIGMGYQ